MKRTKQLLNGTLSKIKDQDTFGQSPQWKFAKGQEDIKSFCGSILSLIILALTILYAWMKVDILLNKKDVNILSTINDQFYSANDIFNFTEHGFNLAVAFTAYDSNPEPILDPTYGEIQFNKFRWGPSDDGFGSGRIRIPSHSCSREELGLSFDRSKAMFMPVYAPSADEVKFYEKKFQCADQENLMLYGDYNSFKASQFNV